MGKIGSLMESGIARLINVLEFRQQPPGLNNPKPSGASIALNKKNRFRQFVFGVEENRKYFTISLLGIVLQLIILKLFFPFPDFISDSYNYIDSAEFNLNVNLWPIGYAKFLSLVHMIHYSDTFLVCIQYIILESALLYFFYTIIYFFQLRPLIRKILFAFLLFNPLCLYLSNCVLSDALFSAITIFWLTYLIWQIHNPRHISLLISAILIGLAFTIRYTAIYYPIINGLAILVSKDRIFSKVVGMLAPLAFMIPFVIFTKAETKQITGTSEFSVFGGWQIANNALYMYNHIIVDPQDLPPQTVALDAMVKKYYQTMPPQFFDFDHFPGTFFIKHANAPLKQYMLKNFKKEHDSSSFLGWGKTSPIYNAYGSYLIRHYPFSFLRYYIWPNTKNYMNPHLEKFGSYNIGLDSVWSPAQYWFKYPTTKVHVASRSLLFHLFFPYPTLFLLANAYCLFLLVSLYKKKGAIRLSPLFRKTIFLSVSFIIINFAFSVFATPIVLRYQVVPFIIICAISLLLRELLYGKLPRKEASNQYY